MTDTDANKPSDSSIQQPVLKEVIVEEFVEADLPLYHRRQVVLRVAAIAQWLAWGSLIVWLLLAFSIGATLSSQVSRSGVNVPAASLIYSLGAALEPLVMVGLAFVLLLAIAQALYILLDMEENTRSKADLVEKADH